MYQKLHDGSLIFDTSRNQLSGAIYMMHGIEIVPACCHRIISMREYSKSAAVSARQAETMSLT